MLNDATRHGDFTADKFQEIQRRIESNLQNVNPAEEYREFTEKHKWVNFFFFIIIIMSSVYDGQISL